MDNGNSLEFHFRMLTADSPAIGRIICLMERDDVYHVEAFFRGRFFSADPENGVRFLDSVEHQNDPYYWDIVKVSQQITDDAIAYAASITGDKYDFFGAFNSALPHDLQFIGTNGYPLHVSDEYFCSLCAAEVAIRAAVPGIGVLPDPSALRRQLKGGAVARSRMISFTDADNTCLESLVEARRIDVSMAVRIVEACGR